MPEQPEAAAGQDQLCESEASRPEKSLAGGSHHRAHLVSASTSMFEETFTANATAEYFHVGQWTFQLPAGHFNMSALTPPSLYRAALFTGLYSEVG